MVGHTWITDQSKSFCVKAWLRKRWDRQTDRQTDRMTNKQTNETRHSHRHSPRRAWGLSHVTTKAKVILAFFYQKSYQLSCGQNALMTPRCLENGWDMANLINFMFCNITWPEMHWMTPKFKFSLRNLFGTKMQSFINLGRKIVF